MRRPELAPTQAATSEPGAQTVRAVVRLTDGTVQVVDTGYAGGIRLNQKLLPPAAQAPAAWPTRLTSTALARPSRRMPAAPLRR